MTPQLHLIAGPNGSGKTSLYQDNIGPRLPELPFVNADAIQAQAKRDGEAIDSYEAARRATQQRDQCLAAGRSLVTETVFSHPLKLAWLQKAVNSGFNVYLYHVHVVDPLISKGRVAYRVTQGGHDVPDDKIIQRYHRCLPLIAEASRLARVTFVYDNSGIDTPHALVLTLHSGRTIIHDPYVLNAKPELPGFIPIPEWIAEAYAHSLIGVAISSDQADTSASEPPVS